MILNFHELISYQNSIAEKYQGTDVWNQTAILKNCSHLELNRIKNLCENFFKSYLSVIQTYKINGISIGYFNIEPYGEANTSFEDSFIQAQESPFFPKEFMEKHKLYQIGSYNTDIICITEGTEIFLPGEILFIDEGDDIFDPQDDQIHPLAPDFETFLILAGNLNQIYQVIDDEDYDELTKEFERRLKVLNIDKRYWPAWVRLV